VYTLRFRASDRTLTDDEVAVARDAAVAEAARRTGAKLRDSAQVQVEWHSEVSPDPPSGA
jgi:hypothetical protein